MSFCQEDGKDKYVFLTSDEANEPSKLSVPEEIDRPENFVKGFIDEKGSLNWECACRGSMVASRCGVEMRDFFQCIHDNMNNEEKADACLEKFHEVKTCMDKFPEHYKSPEEDEAEEGASEKAESQASK
ncbi:mitochondrial intermembrane space import and assembly protein 40-A-like isoform X1 [Pecten maximus]|uniref:mitochondrial intermembrane space import and assembly protein 40-A-like isoform X1 n=1 Tax=Pecten maximus TaxID=6579 RepID=UPI00145865D6|nr:mitochondrial intermembrane space import and assembly protein 40-A-like isoform X1 [Pecten maximus]